MSEVSQDTCGHVFASNTKQDAFARARKGPRLVPLVTCKSSRTLQASSTGVLTLVDENADDAPEVCGLFFEVGPAFEAVLRLTAAVKDLLSPRVARSGQYPDPRYVKLMLLLFSDGPRPQGLLSLHIPAENLPPLLRGAQEGFLADHARRRMRGHRAWSQKWLSTSPNSSQGSCVNATSLCLASPSSSR